MCVGKEEETNILYGSLGSDVRVILKVTTWLDCAAHIATTSDFSHTHKKSVSQRKEKSKKFAVWLWEWWWRKKRVRKKREEMREDLRE